MDDCSENALADLAEAFRFAGAHEISKLFGLETDEFSTPERPTTIVFKLCTVFPTECRNGSRPGDFIRIGARLGFEPSFRL